MVSDIIFFFFFIFSLHSLFFGIIIKYVYNDVLFKNKKGILRELFSLWIYTDKCPETLKIK